MDDAILDPGLGFAPVEADLEAFRAHLLAEVQRLLDEYLSASPPCDGGGGGGVPSSRAINTSAPLTGGGDLSADRTLGISDFVASGGSHARGAVPDPGSTAGTTKFLREDASWAVPPGSTTEAAANTKIRAAFFQG